MIGYLRGKVIAKQPDTNQCVVLSHRVGYEVTVPPNVYDRFGVGDSIALWIHSHIREDIFALYGFATEADKNFFRLMLSVSGLGPKSSLALLSEHGTEKLALYIRGQDATSIATAPGIGKKLAQKIILELQPKVEKLQWLALASRPVEAAKSTAPQTLHPLRDDLSSALLNLGFAPALVKPTVERIFENADAEKAGFEACLKIALKEMNVRHG